VLFGFWRGQQFLELEPRLKPGGKYDMATLELRAGDSISAASARALARAARDFNELHGDPRSAATRASKPAKPKSSRTKPARARPKRA